MTPWCRWLRCWKVWWFLPGARSDDKRNWQKKNDEKKYINSWEKWRKWHDHPSLRRKKMKNVFLWRKSLSKSVKRKHPNASALILVRSAAWISGRANLPCWAAAATRINSCWISSTFFPPTSCDQRWLRKMLRQWLVNGSWCVNCALMVSWWWINMANHNFAKKD